MDDSTPVTPNEITPPSVENQPSPTAGIKTSDFTKKSKSWKNPYALVFVAVFAVIGGYAIINSFAATAALTKVWQTSADWSAGTLSNVAVANNAVSLAPVAAAASTGGPATPTLAPTPAATVAAVTADTNLALKKPVVASSTNDDGQSTPKAIPATYAVDGNLSTRWGSQYSDPQWIYVDLGAMYNINRVQLNWETAYGKAYKIQVSNDAKTWTTAYRTTRGTGKVNNLTGLTASGRYVRMLGTVRGTVWGYSLYEISVYGAGASTSTPAASATYTVAASKPTADSTVSGKTTFSGTQSGFKNVEVWYNGANVGTATISGDTWTASVDTTKQTNGTQTYTVYGWDVPAGQQAKNSSTKDVKVTVNNTATTPTAKVYSKAGNITLSYDAKSSVTWTSLKPQATTPAGTSITYQARSSADNSNWSAWNSDVSKLASSRYIQVQASLSTTNTAATPTLTTLTLGYNSTVASPTVSLTATPTAISAGQNATLTWNSTNTTACTASGGWSGAKAVSGSTATAVLTASATFNISCTGDGGTANASATVSVAAAPTPPTGSSGASSSGGCVSGGVSAPCVGSATTGASGWGNPVFADEFNGSSLDTSKWSSTWFNSGGEMNGVSTSASNVSVSGGNLIMQLANGTGSLIATNPNGGASKGFEFGTGYYVESSVYFPGNGSEIYNWPAFWTNGQSWPATGEIDIAEGLGPLTSNYHYQSNGNHVANNGPSGGSGWANGFHTYAVDRENGMNYIYWDGKLVRSYSTYDGGAQQYLIYNVGSGGTNVTGPSGAMKADYVRVWKK